MDGRRVQVLRVLRLAKLLRILRANRVFMRWESYLEIDYSHLSLMKFIAMVVFTAHWLACGFHMCARIVTEDYVLDQNSEPLITWITEYKYSGSCKNEASDADEAVASPSILGQPGACYLASMFWSLTTLTTIGYGDIVVTNNLERAFGLLAIAVGASMYAYVIGAMSAVIKERDQEVNHFYATMDLLNRFLTEKNFSKAFKLR